MTAIFDGDWIIYRACFSGPNRDFIQVIEAVDFFVLDSLKAIGTETYRLFLTSPVNFRLKIAESYKSTRKQPKPKYFYDVKEYLVNFWDAEVKEGYEADDLCAMNQSEDSVIIGEDKDLLTIPGNHFRIKKTWRENCWIYVTPEQAQRSFFLQLLVGDSADNVPGLKNPDKLHHKNPPCYTEATASPLLEGKSAKEMREVVENQYKIIYGEDWFPKFDLTARLLHLKRSPEDEYYHHYI